MNTPDQLPSPSGGTGNVPPPMVVQQTTVIHVGNQKSVAGAVLLALFFGPLGMLYATVTGALVMFVVNLIVGIPTLGLGLIVTVPIGAVWAGVSASSHNQRLGTMSAQAIAPVPALISVPPPGAPAAWHTDPEGSGRLRYWDGMRWTDHYAGQPEGSGESPDKQLTEGATALPPVVTDGGNVRYFDLGAVMEARDLFCESCGKKMSEDDQFCSACGKMQGATA